MRAGDYVRDDFGILGIWDAGFEDADDGRRPVTYATQANSFADDRRILMQSARPETIRENHHAGSFGPVVFRSDKAAEHGMKAHDVEKGAADNPTLN